MNRKIGLICHQIIKACEQIDCMSESTEQLDQADELKDVCTSICLDELEHVQLLTIQLTGLLSGDAVTNQDECEGSAFAPGDLDCTKNGDCSLVKH